VALIGIIALGSVAWLVHHRASSPTTAVPAAQTPINVIFPEGLRREQIASILAAKTDLSASQYLALTATGGEGEVLSGKKAPRSLEGFLFPATYPIFPTTTVSDVVNEQLTAFRQYTAAVDYRYAESKNLSPYDVLTIASMVEREVAVPSERVVVAGVIYNRLRLGMTLGIDATVQYALGYWKTKLTQSDLQIDSPYNTRRFPGLPPGPICNPGLPSIQAAAHPAHVAYLYYVARNDGTGRHYFATTLAQFNHDVATSNANLARGG
jgi:UPF0755 protein